MFRMLEADSHTAASGSRMIGAGMVDSRMMGTDHRMDGNAGRGLTSTVGRNRYLDLRETHFDDSVSQASGSRGRVPVTAEPLRNREPSISGPCIYELPDDVGHTASRSSRRPSMVAIAPSRHREPSISGPRIYELPDDVTHAGSRSSRRPSVAATASSRRGPLRPAHVSSFTAGSHHYAHQQSQPTDRPRSPGIDSYHTLRITTPDGSTVEFTRSTHTRGLERLLSHCTPLQRDDFLYSPSLGAYSPRSGYHSESESGAGYSDSECEDGCPYWECDCHGSSSAHTRR
ncbi:hypothetical protein AMS68_003043 [Peltaster fructicola]|uniref:Uncharacterized protein n=1 Tax=Peltaster fructicola TaxID=286661 RepID=A0A6H0XS60_9PEZI|nr:hypothetical protein AMS68_003043 [Peltaster fructicola]